MSSRIRAVSFDVGGTLIEPFPSVGHVYSDTAASHGFRGISPDTLNERFRAAWKSRQDFNYSVKTWRKLVLATFGEDCPAEAVIGFFPDLYRRFIQPDAWRLFPGTRELLLELQSMGVLLAVTSNWDDRLRPLLAGLGLSELFKVISISGELGFQKPDPRIFLNTCFNLEVSPGEAIHVGDSQREDIQGACGAGMSAVLFEPHRGDLLRDRVLKSLKLL